MALRQLKYGLCTDIRGINLAGSILKMSKATNKTAAIQQYNIPNNIKAIQKPQR